MAFARKVVVVGLDGFEPTLVDGLLAEGRLPNLRRIAEQGGGGRLGTTLPAQTPVAFATFATGRNPGGHGIFDFVRRNPKTYLPDLSLNRYEQRNPFAMPRAVNLRQGEPVWELLRRASVPSTVIRCPCSYPPDEVLGNMLSGMGVPDLRGGLGTGTYYTTRADEAQKESETLVHVRLEGGVVRSHVVGPRNPKTGKDLTVDFELVLGGDGRSAALRSAADPKELPLEVGRWSSWLKVRFKAGLLTSVRGMVRFLLVRTGPDFALYASPVNFVPDSPLFPISSPPGYAEELQRLLGPYYTTGMVEDHTGLQNGRFDESAYLEQCEQVLDERERMLHHELDRLREGLLFCLFDTPDRVAHMFWRFREEDHPAHRHGRADGMERVIEDHYARCDAMLGRVLQRIDEDTLLLVMSDHGMCSFRRGVHLNSWLLENGYLALKPGVAAGEEAGDMLRHVDWGRTRAYALGLGSMYLNQRGREAEGVVGADEAPGVAAEIAGRLGGLVDPQDGRTAVRSVALRDEVYRGPWASEGPDLVVRFARGYRVSWETGLGGVPAGLFADNDRRWSGDHIVDPELVPGILFANRKLDAQGASLLDLAPTILDALGVPKGEAMEGRSLCP